MDFFNYKTKYFILFRNLKPHFKKGLVRKINFRKENEKRKKKKQFLRENGEKINVYPFQKKI